LTVRLRAHHLLCMLTFVGEGYTPAFTANYRRIAERLSAGEEIEIVSGPDDICAPLLSEASAHCLLPSPKARDEAAAEAVGRLLGVRVEQGARLIPDKALLKRLGRAFAADLIRNACTDCEWSELCSAVAHNHFRNTLVAPC
jgi:hypothetical protein